MQRIVTTPGIPRRARVGCAHTPMGRDRYRLSRPRHLAGARSAVLVALTGASLLALLAAAPQPWLVAPTALPLAVRIMTMVSG